MTLPESTENSPPWGSNIKLVIGLTFVGIVAAFLVRFHTIVVPVLLAFILTYLLHPLAFRLSKATRLSWRMSVNVIFLILMISVIVLFTLSGLAIVQQFQSLIGVVERFVADLPDLVADWSTRVYAIGPYQLDVSQYMSQTSLESLTAELLSAVQPVLGRAGGLLSTLASGTASILGWGFFVVLVSYFVLTDMRKFPNRLVSIEIPGYGADIRRLGRELARIWNAFLRGQVILFTLAVLVYTVLLTVLGMRYALGLALLAGLARFVPYVGPWFTWTMTALVAIFQGSNYFQLDAWHYAILVVVLAIIIDQIFDNLISPRIFGQALGVHPAAVLVAAIIAANLLGLVGVVLAAPVLATLTLVGRYVARKMFNLDPWPEPEGEAKSIEYPWAKWGQRLHGLAHAIRARLKR